MSTERHVSGDPIVAGIVRKMYGDEDQSEPADGTGGQDRDSYSDTQDRDSYQPEDLECDACGALSGEDCRPGCLGKAKYDDETEERRA